MNQNFDNKGKMTPEKAVEILAKHGTHGTIEEAAKMVDFLKFLAELTVEQIVEDAANGATENKKERLH